MHSNNEVTSRCISRFLSSTWQTAVVDGRTRARDETSRRCPHSERTVRIPVAQDAFKPGRLSLRRRDTVCRYRLDGAQRLAVGLGRAHLQPAVSATYKPRRTSPAGRSIREGYERFGSGEGRHKNEGPGFSTCFFNRCVLHCFQEGRKVQVTKWPAHVTSFRCYSHGQKVEAGTLRGQLARLMNIFCTKTFKHAFLSFGEPIKFTRAFGMTVMGEKSRMCR